MGRWRGKRVEAGGQGVAGVEFRFILQRQRRLGYTAEADNPSLELQDHGHE